MLQSVLIVARFEKRIYIPLPEVQARRRMFELNIGTTPHGLSAQDFTALAEQTDGYVRDAIGQCQFELC